MNHKSTFKIIIEKNKRKTKLTNFIGKPCCSFDCGPQRSIHPAGASWSKPQQQQKLIFFLRTSPPIRPEGEE